MFRVSIDMGATSVTVEDLHKFIADENPQDLQVCNMNGVDLWRFNLHSKFLYLKKVPDDTSVFRLLPEGSHLHAPACRILKLPHEHVSHFIFHVRHFKYDHFTVRNAFYEWLKRYRGPGCYFDEYATKLPRHLQEQYGCRNLYALFYDTGYAAYPYDKKLAPPDVFPTETNDFEIESCNYFQLA